MQMEAYCIKREAFDFSHMAMDPEIHAEDKKKKRDHVVISSCNVHGLEQDAM